MTHGKAKTWIEEDRSCRLSLPGKFQGIGYKIIETFQDDVFVNVSGTNPKVLMKFRQMESGNYELIFYTRLDLLSDLSEEEIEQLLLHEKGV